MSTPRSVPLTPCMVLAAASTYVAMASDRLGMGEMVRQCLAQVGLERHAAWGTAWISHVGHRSHQRDPRTRSSWPLPLTGSADELATFAREHEIDDTLPRVGDVALIWSGERKRFVQAGIVSTAVELDDWDRDARVSFPMTTIEGNVTPNGRLGGTGVQAVRRQVTRDGGTMFLRWVLLDGRSAMGEPSIATYRDRGRVMPRSGRGHRCA